MKTILPLTLIILISLHAGISQASQIQPRFQLLPKTLYAHPKPYAIKLSSGDVLIYNLGPAKRQTKAKEYASITYSDSQFIQEFEIYRTQLQKFETVPEPFKAHGPEAIALPNGKALFLGSLYCFYKPKSPLKGTFCLNNQITELYDPRTNTFSLGPPLKRPREGFTTSLLQNGNVLLIGGNPVFNHSQLKSLTPPKPKPLPPEVDQALTPTELTIVTPSHLKRHAFQPNNYSVFRPQKTVTLPTPQPTKQEPPTQISITPAELYNPQSNRFSLIPEINDPSISLSSLTLNNGKVLISGYQKAQLYDPMTHQIQDLADTAQKRCRPMLRKLPDGRVLVLGGRWDTSIERFDPDTETFQVIGHMSELRGNFYNDCSFAPFDATVLKDGRLLITGGAVHHEEHWYTYYTRILNSAEIFDPQTGVSTPIEPMQKARAYHQAILLEDGSVLIVGGDEKQTAELFTP